MNKLSNFFNVDTLDPDDARRRKLLNILLAGTTVLTLLALLAAIVADIARLDTREHINALYLSCLISSVGVVVTFAINHYWSGWLASALFSICLIAIATFFDEPQEVANGRSLLTFVIPILVASFVLHPGAGFIVAGLSSLVIMAVALSAQIVPNPFAMIFFFAIALVSHLSARSLERTLKELRALNLELNQRVEERTQELREAQQELIRKERLAVLGQLSGGVAHELRTPLGAISNAAYFLNMALEEPEPEVKEALEILEKEVVTSDKIISSLLDIARAKPPTLRKVDLNDVLQGTLYRITVPENVEVATQLDQALPFVPADPNQLSQVFTNLIINGIQAMSEGGRLVVKTEALSPEWVTVSFADTGVGIPKENMGRLFEPLFTTKTKGIGLGLALVKALVEGHRGTIEVESEAGKGSTFTVMLPNGRIEERDSEA